MSDYLQGKRLQQVIKLLRLPIPTPVPLKRQKGAILEGELKGYQLLLGKSRGSGLAASLTTWTNEQGVELDTSSKKQNALIWDATGVETVEDLVQGYDFFHEHIRKTMKGGRLLIIGSAPDAKAAASVQASVQALEGLSRALAKETGGKGITCQLVLLDHGLVDKEKELRHKLYPALHFLLSKRSAFISGQVFRISKTVKPLTNVPVAGALKDKVALVTGGAQGIGAAASRTLAREGATVIILDIPLAVDKAVKVAKEIDGKTLLLDITDEETPQRVVDYVKEHFGGVDIVVNNAGITRDRTIAKMSKEYWRQALNVNLDATIRLTEALITDGLRDRGRILGLSSISGIAGNFGQTNYSASKAGMIGYMEALAKQLASRQITANAIAPGFIETKMTANLPFFVKEGGRRLSNLKQGGSPQDVAEGICFLASPGGAGVTGQTLRICGGSMIGA